MFTVTVATRHYSDATRGYNRVVLTTESAHEALEYVYELTGFDGYEGNGGNSRIRSEADSDIVKVRGPNRGWVNIEGLSDLGQCAMTHGSVSFWLHVRMSAK
jgi:hypothetical protein